jgi:serine/threonine-protein kinase
MSPEQLRSSREVDARSDIWSLGVIAYELLARRVPFGGESIAELCVSILNEPPASLTAVRPDVPVELERGILKCLEKNREQRYPNVAELAIALRPFARERGRVSVDNITRTLSSAGVSLSDSSTESMRNPATEIGTSREAMASYQTGSSLTGLGAGAPDAAVATTDKRATQAAWGHTGAARRSNGVVAAVAGGFVILVAGLGIAAWRMASVVLAPETAVSASAGSLAGQPLSSTPTTIDPPTNQPSVTIDIAPTPPPEPSAEPSVEVPPAATVVKTVATHRTPPRTPPRATSKPPPVNTAPKTEPTATSRPSGGLLDGRH